MYLCFFMVFFIIIEHLVKIFTQTIPPLSPCPKIFQYRFDGSEWFGLLSVRNPEFGQTLHVKVILSLRGKPINNYLGEIELLTRGQFSIDLPVIYKIRFPSNHFLPKLFQIIKNNQIICYGSADQSIFVTQIILEHTRKFTFLSNEISPTLQTIPVARPNLNGISGIGDGKDVAAQGTPDKLKDLPIDADFDVKQQFPDGIEKENLRLLKSTCGIKDNHIHNSQDQEQKQRRKIIVRSLKDLNRTTQSSVHLEINNEYTDSIIQKSLIYHSVQEQRQQYQKDVKNNLAIEELNDNNDLLAIKRGGWPWLAAVYVNNLTSLAYQCGGTLVSKRIVISAAHCFQLFMQRYSANEVLIFLGRHNLKNWNEEGSLAAPVDDIFIHPDYNRNLNNYDADLAIIVLKHEVIFNTFIRPACLWFSMNTELVNIVGELGVVISWSLGNLGISQQYTLPKIMKSHITPNQECFQINSLFENLSSNRTFCARNEYEIFNYNIMSQNQSKNGPCAGDSGSGLLMYRNHRWILRGIVVGSIPKTNNNNISGSMAESANINTQGCPQSQYVVYTDVAQFLDWIYAFIL